MTTNQINLAFDYFKEIDSLPTLQEKQRAWLKLHESLMFARGVDGHYIAGEEWTKTKYLDSKFDPSINLVGRLPNQTRIEFDGDEAEAKKYLLEVKSRLKELGFGFIESTHHGKSNYLWVEFTRSVKDKEVEQFLNWIAKEGQVDLNFASSKKVFPCLYAVHWKHSYHREMPIEYFEGNQIDFDSLGLKSTKVLKSRKRTAGGFSYETRKIEFSTESMLDAFLDKVPMFYDRNKIIWKWDFLNYKYEVVDDIDLSLAVNDSGLSRGIVHLVLERARLRIPEQPKNTWIQFKNKIYDFETGEIFEASPKYFITNPLPFEVGNSEDTPTIDKIFEEWVGKEFVPTLYEILAYSAIPNKFMQRLFALIGGGSNGKSTFIGLVQKFIGKINYCSSELKLLAERNFETAILYKKTLCIIGEVDYDDLANTSQIKRLSGEDDVRYEFKGKQPFSDKNTASIVCLTNALPRTPDKSLGFYRRWLIVDFPNQFSVGENPINKIPDYEFQNLARKVLRIIREMHKTRKFSNEGDYTQREKIYEEKSNPIKIYIETQYEDSPGRHTPKKQFCDDFNVWLKSKHQRPLSAQQITRMLKNEAYDVSSRKINGESTQVVVNLTKKNDENQEINEITTVTTDTGDFPIDSPTRKTNLKNGSNLGNLGNLNKKPLLNELNEFQEAFSDEI